MSLTQAYIGQTQARLFTREDGGAGFHLYRYYHGQEMLLASIEISPGQSVRDAIRAFRELADALEKK